MARGCRCGACSRRDAGTDAHSDAHNALFARWAFLVAFHPNVLYLCLAVVPGCFRTAAQGLSTDEKQCHPLQASVGTRMTLPVFDVVLKAAPKASKFDLVHGCL